jgi:hypothetical protein
LASAARLCDAVDATMFPVEGEGLRLVAHEGPIPAHALGQFSGAGTPPGRMVLDYRTVHVADLQAEADEFPEDSSFARLLGFRTILGASAATRRRGDRGDHVRRTDKRPFTDRHVKVLATFADQVAIAIENVRLFTELQEKNQALTQAHTQVSEALGQQMATSEILRVISSAHAEARKPGAGSAPRPTVD